MKSLILATIALAISLFAYGAEVSNHYGFKDDKFVQMDGYDLAFVRAEVDKDHWRMGIFKFRWKGEGPVRLWGFGFQKDGSFRVRFESFSKLINDKWEEIPVMYCGTGMEMFNLKPDTDYILKIPLSRFRNEGTKGVVKIDGDKIALISKPFDLAPLREKASKTGHGQPPPARTQK